MIHNGCIFNTPNAVKREENSDATVIGVTSSYVLSYLRESLCCGRC